MRYIGHIPRRTGLVIPRRGRQSGRMSASDPQLPPDSAMPALRDRIDALDARLVALLAERSALIDEAARIKLREHLPARIDSRVEEVAAHVRGLAQEHGIDAEMIEKVWRMMMDHFIAQEERQLGPDSDR